MAVASVNGVEKLSRHPHPRRITVDTPNGPVHISASPMDLAVISTRPAFGVVNYWRVR